MNRRWIAGGLAAALAVTLTAGALADENTQQAPPAPDAAQQVVDLGSKVSQDIPREEPKEQAGPGESQGENTAPGQAELTWDSLEEQVRKGYLKVLILQEQIDSIGVTDFEKMKEEVRDALNLMAEGMWFQVAMGSMDSFALRSANQTYDAMRDQLDDLNDGTTQRSMEDTVWMLNNMINTDVKLAQATYIQLVEADAGLVTMDRSLAALDRQVRELELRHQLGQISSLALDQVKSGRDSLASQRENILTQTQGGLRGLEFMTGREMTGTTTLGALPLVTGDQVAAMNLEKDLAAAKEKSYTLYDAQKTLDDAREEFEDAGEEYNHNEKKYQYLQARHSWQGAQYTHQATVASFEMGFYTLYDTVKNCWQLLGSAQTALEVEKDNFAVQQLKFDQGNLAKNKLLDAQDTLASAQDKVDTAQRDLFIAWNNYQWAVNYGLVN